MKNSNKANRRYKTFLYQKKQVKIANYHNIDLNKKSVGRFKKHSALDCGNANCGLCRGGRKNRNSSGKDKLTFQEKTNNIKYKEWRNS